MAEAAVLLPVRLETRFDEQPGFQGTRLRVLIVPDSCWFDRHQPASDAELTQLAQAIAAAGGPLATGAPGTAETAAAFEALAGQVGPGRALWLARTPDPARRGTKHARPTRVHGLPAEVGLYAIVGNDLEPGGQPVLLGTCHPTDFEIRPRTEEGGEGWWPSWQDLSDVGLTLTVDLGDTPAGFVDPTEITVLFVSGLGETESVDMFRPHLDAGDLGLAQPGLPTNTVAGTPAADLGSDVAAWRSLGERTTDTEEQRISHALTGDAAALGPLLGSANDQADHIARLLIGLLWPALAGCVLHEVWGEEVFRIPGYGEWAAKLLRPDGPYPVLRVREQPYGVWPVSDWPAWNDEDLEQELGLPLHVIHDDGYAGPERMLGGLASLRDAMAERARTGTGTVVGRDADGLWELLCQTPTSAGYEIRPALHLETLFQAMSPVVQDSIQRWWDSNIEVISKAVGAPPPTPPTDIGHALFTVGEPMPIDLGMVLPAIRRGPNGEPLHLPWLTGDPDRAARQLSEHPEQWLVEALRGFRTLFTGSGVDPRVWEPVSSQLHLWPASLLWRLIMMSGLVMVDQALSEIEPPGYSRDDPIARRVQFPLPGGMGSLVLNGYLTFLNALDELTSIADTSAPNGLVGDLDRVLRGLLDTAAYRVDPWLTGAAWRRLRRQAGSRPIGLFGWVDSPHRGQPGPDLEVGVLLAPSDGQARTAIVLRDRHQSRPGDRWHLDLTSATVRAAARLADEVRVGAHPAEAVGREVERLIGEPTRIDRVRSEFRLRTEHAGRRTCDGLAILELIATDPASPRLVSAGLTAQDIGRIGVLAKGVDAYSDLLVASAAHHALGGRSEAAGQFLDAAAGLSLPPPLDVLATPRSGRSVRTTVLLTIPDTQPAPAGASPAAVASPQVAAWLEATVGDAAGDAWTWRVEAAGVEWSVTLADLGLEPIDAIAIHPVVLDGWAAQAAHANPLATSIVSPPGPLRTRRLAGVLGSTPLSSEDLGLDASAGAGLDAPIRAILGDRLDQLRVAATSLARLLSGELPDPSPGATMRECARWGIQPTGDLADGAREAADVLRHRLDALPADTSSLSVRALTRALVDLVAPDNPLPIAAGVPIDVLRTAVGPLVGEPSDGAGRPRLDRTWLELVAAVRPPLARLEALQCLAAMTGDRPFAAATTHPNDPWLTQVPPPPRGTGQSPRLVVAYGPSPLPRSGRVAVTVLDAWAEVIPDASHVAAAGFRFNAPGSRAPQAILIAVTPVAGNELTPDVLLRTVMEARKTAQARTARPEDLGIVDLLQGAILPAFEPGGFQFAVPGTHDHWPT